MYRALFLLTAIFCGTMLNAQNSELDELFPTETEAVMRFIVTDDNKIPEEGAQIHVESEDKTFSKDGVANIDGLFPVLLEEGKKYKIRVRKFGKEFHFEREVPVAEGGYEYTQYLMIKVVTFYVRGFTLDHLYFDIGKWDIKKESIPTLEKLYVSFVKNPKLKVEIAGHTDNVGNDENNLRLSQRRADALRDYLIKKGVDPERLLSKGYGESNPVAPNTTEAGKAKNRRTEVRVIEE